MHGAFLILFAILGLETLALFNIFSMSVFAFSIYANLQSWFATSLTFVFSEMLIHSTLCVIFIGWDSGFHYYILTLVMVAFFAPWKSYMIKSLAVALCCSVYISLKYYSVANTPLETLDTVVLMSIDAGNIIGLFFVVAMLSLYYNYAAATAEELLRKEYQRSEKLLHNILPVSIAERLKSNPITIADGFNETTILFADIVGFTRLSAKVSPEELVQLLNMLFTEFDTLSEQHHLEKIKTIGDAYMVASGLPEYRKDHAEIMAKMALDMLKVTQEINSTLNLDTDIDIRIGINSGKVVAGVIGKKKFAYDLWGDSVNTASRMESHGIPGKVHVTQATYDLLKEKYILTNRGEIDVKGKGLINTYFLTQQKVLVA